MLHSFVLCFYSFSYFLVVRSPEEGGAGIFAKTHINKEETIIALPSKHYNLETLMNLIPNEIQTKTSVLEKLINGGNDDKTMALIGALTCACLLKDHCENVNAAIGPYWNVLATTNCQDHVLYWSQEEVDSLLMNTISWTKVGDTHQALRKMKQVLGPSLTSDTSMSLYRTLSQDDVMSTIQKSLALAVSRVFSHPSYGYQMLPVIDLLNHSHENNVQWCMQDDARAMVVAVRDIKQGEELYSSYGKKGSWDWGTDYGFCPDRHSWNDSVAIPLLPLSLNLSEDMISSISEWLYDSLRHRVDILSLTIQRSQDDSKSRVIRPCIIWKMSRPLSELLAIYNPIVQVLEDLGCDNHIIPRSKKLRLDNKDALDSYRGYELALDCLISRLEYLNQGSLISKQWINNHNDKVSDWRIILSNNLREAEWDTCIDMKRRLELHLRKEGFHVA